MFSFSTGTLRFLPFFSHSSFLFEIYCYPYKKKLQKIDFGIGAAGFYYDRWFSVVCIYIYIYVSGGVGVSV